MHNHHKTFDIDPSHAHFKWNNALAPVLTIPSGTKLTCSLLDGGNNQITATSTAASIPTFDFTLADPAFGPIYITDAEPGDVLSITFHSFRPADHGWTAIFPGFGLLSDEFPTAELKIWDLKSAKESGFAVFKKGIHVPLRPFLGVVGVAPEEDGEFSTIPPYVTGGNIDCKHITVGSTLFLPVKVKGALLSLGDGHAAQGDGEVCGTAIETPMEVEIEVGVLKGKKHVQSPHYVTKGRVDGPEDRGEYAALGIDADLREAARKAVRSIVEWLGVEKGLSRVEAYMLASVAGDLRMSEVVDMPHYAVACSIPLNIFVDEDP